MKLSKKENQLKHSEEYIKWRYEVYRNDNYTCQICGAKGKRIEAHHIKKFSDFPELRFDIKNGITLCFNCHRQICGKEKLVEKYFLGLKENGVNSVKLPKRENTEPSRRGDLPEGVTTRNQVFDIKQFIKKRVKCKGCGKIIYRHYYRVQKNKNGFVCSDKCRGIWFSKLYNSSKNPLRKKIKPQKCLYCGKYTNTPSDRSRKKKYCNNSCQVKYERKKGLRVNKPYLNGKWTKKTEHCLSCKTKNKQHYGKGLCMTCYNKQYNQRQ